MLTHDKSYLSLALRAIEFFAIMDSNSSGYSSRSQIILPEWQKKSVYDILSAGLVRKDKGQEFDRDVSHHAKG